MYFQETEKVKHVTFNVIINHVFHENVTEILEVVQKIRMISSLILNTFISFFFFFLQILVTKKLIMTAYNK